MVGSLLRNALHWRRSAFIAQLIACRFASGVSKMSAANGITVRIVKPDDHDRVLNFIRLHYYHEEPLTIGIEPKQQDDADEEFNMSNIAHGTCVMAVESDQIHDDNAQDELIVGAILAGPKETNEADHMLEEAAIFGNTKWGHTLQFLAGVERDANVYQRYGVSRALHAHVLGVHNRMRGKGIGALLFKNLIKVAQTKNYPLLTADCTSYYSARLCERLGWECVNTAPYADYKDSTGRQVFNPPAPHSCVKTYAIRL